jgi:hypothetical protein
VRAFNASRLQLRAQAAGEERERDLALLHYAVETERAGEAEERRKRDAEREAMRQYTEHLREQMEKEAKDAWKLDRAQVWEARYKGALLVMVDEAPQ